METNMHKKRSSNSKQGKVLHEHGATLGESSQDKDRTKSGKSSKTSKNSRNPRNPRSARNPRNPRNARPSRNSRDQNLMDRIPENLRNYVTGTIDMKSSGKSYLLPDNKELEDIYIAANHSKHALDGDMVKVLLFPQRSGRHMEGQVVEILKRNKKNIVGIIENSGNFAFLIPDNTSVPVDIFLSKDKLNGAKNGDKVLVSILEWPEHLNNPVGEVVHVLGKPGDNNVEMQSILAEYDFPLQYPEKAIKEAEKMNETITAKELQSRTDYRDTYTCTIDPADAKDFDDALSYRKLPNGNTEVGVHIADVSYFVKPDSCIEEEAYQRATSVYLVDRTIAMLPERLCNDLCSLKPLVDRFTFSIVFELDAQAQIVNSH
ncbi:MAG: RNB domain-containing ribonuclease, partial [Bacteroidales bacterium]